MNIREHEDRLLHDPRALECLEGSIAETIIIDDVLVACRGVAPYLDGLADIWLIPSVYLEKYAVKALKEARQWIEEAQEDLCLRRMETLCLADNLHDRWMTALSFEKEGTKRQYYGGKDYNMWGRIWE